MFIATLSTGKTVVEGKDVPHFDGCPDGITSLQLALPHKIFKLVGKKAVTRNAIVAIGKYAKYYSAKIAVANVMALSKEGSVAISQSAGSITHEIIAGIDEKRNEVLYVKLNVKTGDITIEKFDLDTWIKTDQVDPKSFKKGVI